MFELKLSQVEALLADLHDIGATKRSALRARLKHFQRLGFPQGTNTGKGQAASYGPAECVQLLIAMEFLQLGLTPERAISIIKLDWERVCVPAVRMAIYPNFLFKDPDKLDYFLYLDPVGLASLQDTPTDEDISSDSFFYAGMGLLLERLKDSQGDRAFRRLSLVNVTEMMLMSATIIGDLNIIPATDFLRDIHSWSIAVDGDWTGSRTTFENLNSADIEMIETAGTSDSQLRQIEDNLSAKAITQLKQSGGSISVLSTDVIEELKGADLIQSGDLFGEPEGSLHFTVAGAFLIKHLVEGQL